MENKDEKTAASECKKALQCLYLEVDGSVAEDVDNKVSAYVYELQSENQKLRKAVDYVKWWIKVNNEGDNVNFDFKEIDV